MLVARQTDHARGLRDAGSLSVGNIVVVGSRGRQLEVSILRISGLEVLGVVERVRG